MITANHICIFVTISAIIQHSGRAIYVQYNQDYNISGRNPGKELLTSQ